MFIQVVVETATTFLMRTLFERGSFMLSSIGMSRKGALAVATISKAHTAHSIFSLEEEVVLARQFYPKSQGIRIFTHHKYLDLDRF